MELQEPDANCLVLSDDEPEAEHTDDPLNIEGLVSGEEFPDSSLVALELYDNEDNVSTVSAPEIVEFASLDFLDSENCDGSAVKEIADHSVDSFELIEDSDSSDSAPEIIGFASGGKVTDFVSEVTLDDNPIIIDETEVQLGDVEEISEVRPTEADKNIVVTEVLKLSDNAHPKISVTIPRVENFAKSVQVVYKKTRPPTPVNVKQKRKSALLIRNNCDGKKSAVELSAKKTVKPATETKYVQIQPKGHISAVELSAEISDEPANELHYVKIQPKVHPHQTPALAKKAVQESILKSCSPKILKRKELSKKEDLKVVTQNCKEFKFVFIDKKPSAKVRISPDLQANAAKWEKK